jgi:hypothetical protein
MLPVRPHCIFLSISGDHSTCVYVALLEQFLVTALLHYLYSYRFWLLGWSLIARLCGNLGTLVANFTVAMVLNASAHL